MSNYLWDGCIKIASSGNAHPLSDLEWLIAHLSSEVVYTIDAISDLRGTVTEHVVVNDLFKAHIIASREYRNSRNVLLYVLMKGNDLSDCSILRLRYGEDDRNKHWFRAS